MIDTLKNVLATLNTISVVGFDNQDKFVGCFVAIQSVVKKLEEAEENGNKIH